MGRPGPALAWVLAHSVEGQGASLAFSHSPLSPPDLTLIYPTRPLLPKTFYEHFWTLNETQIPFHNLLWPYPPQQPQCSPKAPCAPQPPQWNREAGTWGHEGIHLQRPAHHGASRGPQVWLGCPQNKHWCNVISTSHSDRHTHTHSQPTQAPHAAMPLPTRARWKMLQTPPDQAGTHPCWLQPWTPSLPQSETRSSCQTPPVKLSSFPCSRDTSRSLMHGEWGGQGSGSPMGLWLGESREFPLGRTQTPAALSSPSGTCTP